MSLKTGFNISDRILKIKNIFYFTFIFNAIGCSVLNEIMEVSSSFENVWYMQNIFSPSRIHIYMEVLFFPLSLHKKMIRHTDSIDIELFST